MLSTVDSLALTISFSCAQRFGGRQIQRGVPVSGCIQFRKGVGTLVVGAAGVYA